MSRFAEDVLRDGESYTPAGDWWEYALVLPAFWICVYGVYRLIKASGRHKLWVAAGCAVAAYAVIGMAGVFYVALALGCVIGGASDRI